MKPLSWDKQLGLASPLKCAANQSGQTNNPSKDKNEVGLDVSHHIHLAPEGRGKYFFLDIPSHRISEIGSRVENRRSGCILPVAVGMLSHGPPQSGLA